MTTPSPIPRARLVAVKLPAPKIRFAKITPVTKPAARVVQEKGAPTNG